MKIKKENQSKNNDWRLPKQIEVPKEVAEFLISVLKNHQKEITENFSDQLVNNEEQKDEFVINGEFMELEDILYVHLKPRKHSRMITGGSIR